MPIKGRPNKYISIDEILDKISEYDIYSYYLGSNFRINTATYSPFRDDHIPSFLIGNKMNHLRHIDFGDDTYRGDCFDFVCQLYNIPLEDAVYKIAADFNIIKDLGNNLSFKSIKEKQKRNTANHGKNKKYALIQVSTKPFTKKELKYWSDYYQSIEDLKRENIFSLKKVYINKRKFQLYKDEMVFGYLYGEKYWKIYIPFAKNKERKWRSNVPIDFMDGLDNISNKKENTIVTKSKKDKMVLLKFLPQVCSVQSENTASLSPKSIKHIINNSKEVFINFDGDEPGKRSSFKITKELGFKHINVPDGYVKKGIKDFADLAKYRDLKIVKSHFKRKKVL